LPGDSISDSCLDAGWFFVCRRRQTTRPNARIAEKPSTIGGARYKGNGCLTSYSPNIMEESFKKLDRPCGFTYTLRHPGIKGAMEANRDLETGASVLSKEGDAMKWGGYNRKGEERMVKVFKKLFSGKAAYYLLTFAALALLLAENIKWRPDGRG
jgi:hypothetical protein